MAGASTNKAEKAGEVGEVKGGQEEESEFYPKYDGKPLQDFKQVSNSINLHFLKITLVLLNGDWVREEQEKRCQAS